jgi:AcrR family transcriptional regulator
MGEDSSEFLEMSDAVAANESQPARESGKLRQILDGARRVFQADGFDGSSMNDIARAANVSKGPLYVYFPSKDALFTALVRDDHVRQAERICEFGDHEADLSTTLFVFGESLLGLMCKPSTIAQFRTVVAVAEKFPDVGRAFFDAGPRYGVERLGAYLAQQMQAGALRTADPIEAAMDFTQLLQGGIFKQMLFRCADVPAPGRIGSEVLRAINVFLRAYAPDAIP